MLGIFKRVERVRTLSKHINVSAKHELFPFILHLFDFKIWMLKLLASEIRQKIRVVLGRSVDVRQAKIKMFGE